MRIDLPAASLPPASWRASLALRYARAGAATRLVQRTHSGPLRVQKAFYPEGETVCHNIVLHPPAGIAGGDALCIDVTADAAAHALLTTPGAAKWYRANGKPASQRVSIRLEQDARLEWLPQETIFFDATDAHLLQQVELAPGARYLGCDILCFGRSASGERFARGTVRQQLQVRQAGRLLWWDQGVLHGGSSAMQSPHVLGGATVCATLLAAGRCADAALIAQLRALDPALGVTALKSVSVVRYLGHDAECARKLMAQAWQALRPHWMARPATELRIWNT
ncbi:MULTISPECIES: urease accessory protein UreD [unclassified Duganella]|uniref:urease accessory protein UreD n=1 Tax=unclassified Duganella TaxID=2636909 RepID=UPI0006FE4D3B|nr:MULTISPECIES: urease accessory protein UreD [unclassified Duganella]KQV51422.1 urease accessory protein UreD [Duganella sp. Root336D2]KRC03055.1 urease accessory protein UreD [Duganella sp. Root198D2]